MPVLQGMRDGSSPYMDGFQSDGTLARDSVNSQVLYATPASERSGMPIGFFLERTITDVLHTVELDLTGHVCGNVIWSLVIYVNLFKFPTYARRIKSFQAH